MKIRTDFVTNSSSSSFVVDILIENKNGSTYECKVDTDTEYVGSVNLSIEADTLLKADSIDQLAEKLSDNTEIIREDDGEAEDLVTNGDYETLEDAQKYLQGKIDTIKLPLIQMLTDLRRDTTDINEINTIKLRRTWIAWGEPSSALLFNLENILPELKPLCLDVIDAEESDKQNALDVLGKYLGKQKIKLFGGWQDTWPTEFLGSTASTEIQWETTADTLEAFARKIVEGKGFSGNDWAEEVTIIDMQNKKVYQKNYYPIDKWFPENNSLKDYNFIDPANLAVKKEPPAFRDEVLEGNTKEKSWGDGKIIPYIDNLKNMELCSVGDRVELKIGIEPYFNEFNCVDVYKSTGKIGFVNDMNLAKMLQENKISRAEILELVPSKKRKDYKYKEAKIRIFFHTGQNKNN